MGNACEITHAFAFLYYEKWERKYMIMIVGLNEMFYVPYNILFIFLHNHTILGLYWMASSAWGRVTFFHPHTRVHLHTQPSYTH